MEADQGESRPLEGLNAVERDLLSLLGRGHTAKSIAQLRSLSEAAVNERFRSARRKTGIGSSREIARQVVALENRHDFIGLADPSSSPADFHRPDKATSRPLSLLRRWRLPMMTAGLFAIAILAQQTSVTPDHTPQTAPIPPEATRPFTPEAGLAPTSSPDLVALHGEANSPPTDAMWSTETETALAQAYGRLPILSEAIESLSVTCGASVCEVIGITRPDLSSADTQALANELSVRMLASTGVQLKLNLISQSFNASSSDMGPAVSKSRFVSYWRRSSRD